MPILNLGNEIQLSTAILEMWANHRSYNLIKISWLRLQYIQNEIALCCYIVQWTLNFNELSKCPPKSLSSAILVNQSVLIHFHMVLHCLFEPICMTIYWLASKRFYQCCDISVVCFNNLVDPQVQSAFTLQTIWYNRQIINFMKGSTTRRRSFM